MRKRVISWLLAISMALSPTYLVAGAMPSAAKNQEARQTLSAAPIDQEVYEAEDAALSGAMAASNLDDYSGTGFVDGMEAGASVQFAVDVPADGDYAVRLRYSNGSGEARSASLYANGEKVRAVNLPKMVNWDTWGAKTESVPLKAGKNTISYQLDEGDTGVQVKLDCISLANLYEAEDAEVLNGNKTAKDHEGYSGTGFAAGFEKDGAGVRFTVDTPEAGTYAMVVRYANGKNNGDSQKLTCSVNGSTQKVRFGDLGSWEEWEDRSVTVELKAGTNTIDLVKNSDDGGGLNIDYITLKKTQWTYVGNVDSVENATDNELIFRCDNAKVSIKSVSPNALKVWCEPTGRFDRKYDSFAVIDEAVDPEPLHAEDKGGFYLISTGTMDVQVNKSPFRLTYLDKNGALLCEGDEQSMGWSTDNEVLVQNKKQADERFWGLGEKTESFEKTGTKLAMWSTDYLGGEGNSLVPEYGEGRWYMSNPHFLSSKGYSIYFDNTSRTVFDLGKTNPDSYSFGALNPAPAGELLYYFMYGPSMKQISKTFTDMIGKTFFAPEYAYGNIQCHYGYKQSDIERVAQTYRDKEIPLDMMMADIEWYQYLCSPTQWNKNNFPDPESMIDKLQKLNLRMGVIDDPNVTKAQPDDYPYGTEKDYFMHARTGDQKDIIWPWGSTSGLTDFFNPEAQDWWGEQHNMILNQGVEGFWLDMNEPARYRPDWVGWNEDGKAWGDMNELHNVYAIQHNEAMYDKVTENGSRPFMLTRSGFTGSSRYVSPWTGDIGCGWNDMHEQIRLGTSLSLSGFNYWGFDIGGFNGMPSSNQFKRWIQLATFTPVHRFHYSSGLAAKEPWELGGEEVAREYINLRYRLIPYTYSLTADNILGIGIEKGLGEGGTGVPLVRPMAMEFQDDPNTYGIDTQFMNGPSFLVAPVVEDSTVKQVYLPAGDWYDYDNGKTVYKGGATLSYSAPVTLLPVFVKAGSIIPMQPEMQYVGEKPVDVLTLDVYPTMQDGSFDFVLYEDDGETDAYKDGVYTTTKYDCAVKAEEDKNTITLNVGARTGSYADIAPRSYLLQFHKAAYTDLSVQYDGAAVTQYNSLEALNAAESGYYADAASEICYVKIQDTAKASTVTVSGSPAPVFEFEAEDAELLGEAKSEAVYGGYSGTGYAAWIHNPGDGVRFSPITVPVDGDYTVFVRYGNGDGVARTMSIYANDAEADAQQVVFPPLKSWNLWDELPVTVSLKAGKNTITLVTGEKDSANVNLDRITVSKQPMVMTQVPVPNGGFESGTTENWKVDTMTEVRSGVDDADAFGGNNKFYFYQKAAYEARLSQTVNGLPDGTYRVNAMVKISNSAAQVSRMELTGYNGAAESLVTIPFNSAYQKFSSEIEVTDGKVNIAFYCKGAKSTSMQVDNVEIWKIDTEKPKDTYAVQVAAGQPATLSAQSSAAMGDTVKVFVSGIPEGKMVKQVSAVDADGTTLDVLEVEKDKAYSFVMPAKAVTLSVALVDIADVAKAVINRDTVVRIEAEDFDEQGGDPAMGSKAGVKTESCGDVGGTLNVGSTDAGDYMVYKNIYVKDAGTYQFRLRVASNNTQGGVEGSPDGVTIVTTAAPEGVVGTIPFTGAWQAYTDIYLNVPLEAGLQTIRFNVTHEGWNFNYFAVQMEAKAVITADSTTKIEAEDFDGQGGDNEDPSKIGIRVEDCSDVGGGKNIGSTDAGDYFYYDNIMVKDAGTYQFTLRVASKNTDGGVQGSPNGVSIVTTAAPDGVTASIPYTGGWQTYTDVKVLVPLKEGRQTIRFNVTHEGWNINYFAVSVPVEMPTYEDVSMVNRWKNQYLLDDGSGVLKYAGEMDGNNREAYTWTFAPDDDGNYTIQNKATGNYLVNDGSGFIACAAEVGEGDSGKWILRTVSGYTKITSLLDDTVSLALETQDEENRAELSEAPDNWYSAHFTLNSTRFDYDIYPDKIVDGVYTMTAKDGKQLYSSYENSTWKLSKDISGLPQFKAENMPISEAIYNMALQESLEDIFTEKSIHTGETVEVFNTGANWNKVWTRDTAMSVQYSLGWVFPEQSRNSLLQKIQGDPKEWVEDTGTGGSYPSSTDRIIMAMASWEDYLATGDTEFLSTIYDVTAYTAEKDLHNIYDANTGLFKGETSGLDHRSKTYPDWMDEGYFSDIMESKSCNTNIEFAVMFKVLEQASEILGKDPAETAKWAKHFEDLKQAINDNFWMEDRNYYASWQYPEYMGNALADKTDVLAVGYAIYFDIATPEMAEKMMENYPLVKYGANTVYPQKRGKQFSAIYHNRGVWPGWEAALMEAAMKGGNRQLAEEIMKSIMYGAARNLSNDEVINYETGVGNNAHRQLWSVAGQLSNYYRVLFGMMYEQDGIHFTPYVPDWMEGPFTLSNYKYRDATIDFTLSGKGDTIKSMTVNGKEVGAGYVFPADASGKYTIEMVVEDSGSRSKVNLKPENLAICPDLPEMKLADGTLTWTPNSAYTYKLWTGSAYVDVTGVSSYKIPKDQYGSYSLVAVDQAGVASELSKPIVWNPENSVQIYEAEDASYNDGCKANSIKGYFGSGYVMDNRPGTGAELTFTIHVPEDGEYLVSTLYNNGGDTTSGNYGAIRSMLVDGVDMGTMSFSVTFNDVFYRSPRMKLHLTAGEHTVGFTFNNGNNYDQNMNIKRNNVAIDQMIVERLGGKTIPSEPQLLNVQWNPNQAEVEIAGETEVVIDGNGIYGAKVVPGTKLTFTFTPANGPFASAKLNGEDIPFEAGGFTYTYTMPNDKSVLRFTFTSVNKSVLETLLEKANEVTDEQLAGLVWSVSNRFIVARDNAKAVYEDDTATQEEVNEAWKELLDAMHYLSFEAGTKEQLEYWLDYAAMLDLDNFTPKSLEGYAEALAYAEEIYNDEGETLKAEVEKAVNNLHDAIMRLEFKANTETLALFVKQAQEIDLDEYLDGAEKEAFEAILPQAEAVLADANATQKQVDEMTDKLFDALTGLRVTPDREALKDLLEESEALDPADYTEASYAILRAALNLAWDTCNDDTATPKDIAVQFATVEKARAGLALADKPEEPAKPDSKPSHKPSNSGSKKPVGNTSGTGTAVAVTNPVIGAAQNVMGQKSVRSDTTADFTLKRGSAYCFKMTVTGGNAAPDFTVGNGKVLKTQFVAKIGNDYYYRVWAVGAPGQSTGVYTTMAGENPQQHCVVTIG